MESLISLSDDLPKLEGFFTTTVAKAVDTLRNLLNNDPAKLEQHILVDEKSVDSYLLNGWKWKEGRYDIQKGLRDLVDILNKACHLTHALFIATQPRCSYTGNDIHRQCPKGQAEQLQPSQRLIEPNATEEAVRPDEAHIKYP